MKTLLAIVGLVLVYYIGYQWWKKRRESVKE